MYFFYTIFCEYSLIYSTSKRALWYDEYNQRAVGSKRRKKKCVHHMLFKAIIYYTYVTAKRKINVIRTIIIVRFRIQ